MSHFIDFLSTNWFSILYVVLSIVSILVLFFRKSRIVNNDLLDIILELPLWIREAECQFGSGQGDSKFSYVFNSVIKRLVAYTGCTSAQVIAKYGELINKAIENILSTPEKKEVIR